MASQRKYVTKHCLFCDKNEKLKELYPKTFQDSDLTPAVFSARRTTEHFHYRMVRCENCRLVFSRETLSDNDLQELYSESAVTFTDQMDVLRRDYWRPLDRFQFRLKGGSAIEVGCSSGFFLEELTARGVNKVMGFEPSQEAKHLARPEVKSRITSNFFMGRQSVADEKFDLICSFQTLDHIPDPKEFLQHCREVLKPGGLVYFITHNVEALQAKVLGEKSPIIDVEHIYLYSKQTLPRLLNESGFRVLDTGSVTNSYPLNYWVQMFPMKPAMRKVASGFLNGTGLGKFAPAINAGNIYSIAELGS